MLKVRFTITSLVLALSCAAKAQIPGPTETASITSAPPHLATGLLYISKADTNAPGLHNPVLVVEGFDLDNSMNWPELYELLNKENLVEEIQAFGRDLVVLNFTDSTVNIHANAALNEAAIEYINANRADPSDKFTAVGASLGGLTLRETLVNMPNHDVDTWISFDAPHEGANIPLGVQEFLEFFEPYNAAAADLLSALDSPAARQMLLVHHDHPDGLAGESLIYRSSFVSAMNAVGYPTNCKTIAVSNGSGLGEKLPFNPGDLIIHWEDSDLFSASSADIHALPQALARVFYGSVRILFSTTTTNMNSYHELPLDNAPGGTRSTFYQLFTNLTTSTDDYCNYTNHCFIPTVSALGIPIDNIESNLSAYTELTALSPFDEIHYATNNEAHVEINPRNKRWIMRAALENHDSDGDGWDDYQEFLMGTDHASAESGLAIDLLIHAQLTNGIIEITWAAFPNTRYELWHTEDLTESWILADTIPPTSETEITNIYEVPTTATNFFFRILGEPIDPVTD